MPNSVVCVSEDGARPFYATIPVSVKLPERSDGADLVPLYLSTNSRIHWVEAVARIVNLKEANYSHGPLRPGQAALVEPHNQHTCFRTLVRFVFRDNFSPLAYDTDPLLS